jgi:hypothetical protein
MNNDKVLKEKLNSLDTLSSGIVFGKEEAWDKLQARMDKPAKRIALMPWLAAAAVLLLLFVTVLFTLDNNTPVQEVVKNDLPEQPVQVNKSVATPGEQPTIVTQKNIPAISRKVIRHTTGTENKHVDHPLQEEVQIVQAPVAETLVVENIAPVTKTPVTSVSNIPTRVVHINDMVNDAGAATTVAANTSFKKVTGQVIHLNDIKDYQVRTNNYLRQQKDFMVSIPLFNAATEYNSIPSSDNSNYTRSNLLKFKIN